MGKITQFYLNKASYIAVDEDGSEILLEVNYWDSDFTVSQKHGELEAYAARLLQKKHKINFVHKMKEE
ncbi:MAG TPA: hypothetical protein VLH19_01770 [Patescibacteria group bacterium]|nr:hypothetical protein [Patescibacteria group bacterium]